MGKINLLSPLVSNMIAAGEVLERPSSAVKELIENSLDAGAKRIIIEVENGGRTRIKVTDNGIGMSEEDAKNCFLRHATSKIKNAEDLGEISTMGFRGEALASIAAVAKVNLVTRTADSIEGTKVVIEAGEIKEASPAGCGQGTSIEIKELFFNTPARMKFLKSDTTETALITETVEKFVLARPDVSFKLIKNGREALYSAGDNDSFSNLTNIYGREITDNLVSVQYENNGISINGYIGNEKILKTGRKYQTFFVNGRIVKNKIFFAATDEAMKGRAVTGYHPFLILDIKILPSLTDVNVHPTKAEIKFTDDRAVFNNIYFAIRSAFEVEGMAKAKKEKKEEEFVEQSFVITPKIKEEDTVKFNVPEPFKIKESSYNEKFNEIKTQKFEALKPVEAEEKAKEIPEEPVVIQAEKLTLRQPSFTYEPDKKDEPEVTVVPPVCDYKIIGQLFNTYVVIEKDDCMYLLDQHAAHERLLYDKLKKELSEKELITQKLLVPYVVKLTPSEIAVIEDNCEFFASLGFDISDYGGGSVAVREIPFGIDEKEICELLSEICEMIYENRTADLTKKQEKAVATLACKAAIKGNNSYSEYELKKLVEKVLSEQEDNTCPHGRPLFAKFDKKTIDKQFRRI